MNNLSPQINAILPAEVWTLCLSYTNSTTQQQFSRVNRLTYAIATNLFIQQGRAWGFIEDLHHRQMRCHLRSLPANQLLLSYGTTDSNAIIRQNPQQTRAYELSQQIERVAGWIREVYPEGSPEGAMPANLSAREVLEWFFSLPLERMAHLYCDDSFARKEKSWGDWKAFHLFAERVLDNEDHGTISKQKSQLLFKGFQSAAVGDHRELASLLLKIYLINKVDCEYPLNPDQPLNSNPRLYEAGLLFWAIYHENEELLRALLAANAIVTQTTWDHGSRTSTMRPLLLESLNRDNPNQVEFDPAAPMRDVHQKLRKAIENGKPLTVQNIRWLSGCNFRYEDGKTPLDLAMETWAVCYADPTASENQIFDRSDTVLAMILNNVIDTNIRNEQGRTPLHLAKELRSRSKAPSQTAAVGAVALKVLAAAAILGALYLTALAITIAPLLATGIITGIIAVVTGLLFISAFPALAQSDYIKAQKELSEMKKRRLDSLIGHIQEAGALDLPDNEGIRPSDL